MVFSSVIFIFYFLPVFLAGYYLSGWRTGALLLGSALFYTWGEGPYVLLLAALVALNWAGGLTLAEAPERRRKLILIALIAVDLAVLGWFKYAAFLADSLNQMLSGAPFPVPHTRLPLGISFFTFQLISYQFDVWRRQVEPEREPLKFAAYVMMFPHLIAGPIVRFAQIRDELHTDRRRTGRIGLGVQYFIVGLCQKVLVANTVAPLADHAFGLKPEALDAGTAWLGTTAYTLQIYFDFAGYSNMAIGLAFMLGFTFPKNFDHPYASRSITDFWRRWHISLSSWFRDYVYIPLGGNRGGPAKTVRNLLVVFVLTGLWHGAAWNFLVWGLWHGGFLLLERFGLDRVLARLPRVASTAYALLTVMFGWVLFRDETLGEAVRFWGAMVDPAGWRPLPVETLILLDAERLAALAVGALLAFPTLSWLLDRRGTRKLAPAPHLEPRLDTQGVHVLSTPILLAGLIVAVAALAGSSLNPFLYFRF